MNTWKRIKKTGASSVDIYALLGIRHQYVSRWRADPTSLQAKRYQKYNMITIAQELFELTDAETEAFANKAGLSMPKASMGEEFSTEIFPYGMSTKTTAPQFTSFARHFNAAIEAYPGKIKDLYETACVSERMLRYIRTGANITKGSVLAVLITIGKDLDSIQECLKKAGLILSKSLHSDTVVMWMVENEPHSYKGTSLVYRINETLDRLELPLLMTRFKSD